jgi:hypothetical protein
MNAPMTADEVAKRNLIFLRSKLSDSSDEDTPSLAPDLLPSDLTFLSTLNSAAFSVEKTLAQLVAILHGKMEEIVKREDGQIALEKAITGFTKAYWQVLMSDERLANPVNDVLKAVLYYKGRKDMAWVSGLCERLDLSRRMEMVGFKLDAISEQHQLEIEVRRTEEKRTKQRKKEDEKRLKLFPEAKRPREPPTSELEIPNVSLEDVFGPDLEIDKEM